MTLHAYIFLSLALFSLGLVAVVSRRNLIAVLIGVELMMNAASLNFMAFNRYVVKDPAVGQVFGRASDFRPDTVLGQRDVGI